MNKLVEALSYVRLTGYVPWADDGERALTEQMQAQDLIEFEPETVREHRLEPFRWKRPGRYFLTRAGRAILRNALP